MGRYYNTMRTPVAATLRDGSSACFMPKRWTTLADAQEGAPQVGEYVRKGILKYRPDREAEPAPAAPEAPAPGQASAPVQASIGVHVVAESAVPAEEAFPAGDEGDPEAKASSRARSRR